MAIDKTNWSSNQPLVNAQWARTSGIDTNIRLYDDLTISYDDSLVFYDDYDAATITTEDIKFDNWATVGNVNNGNWSDTNVDKNLWSNTDSPSVSSWTDNT